LKIQINIDGLSLYKSSNEEIWPILCLIKNLRAAPFVVGVFSGTGKPENVEEYLKEFIDELINILKNGFHINSIFYKVIFDCFICDAPARAYLK
ncbi:hypothetical protein HELRODRAFT_127285, partial [Helobdella robusta]|uniref:Uncharacterized protein n=1 Tax=Helobdella robusta TaxID=6412 RepID=T1EHD7_HELRO